MGNNVVTRFQNGVTNVNQDNLFGDLVQPDPTLLHEYWDDFDQYVAGDWTVTETDSGATEALTAGDGGLILLTNTAADNDIVQLQKLPASFLFEAGKKTFFRCRFKVSDATQSDVVVGLANANASGLLTNAWTDGIYFYKADGAATADIFVRKNTTTGSTTVASVATLADNTFIELGWYYDGISTVAYEVNGSVIGSLSGSSSYLPDANVTVTLALGNGEAAAKTMTIDYVYVAKER
jgi:hypothetical protein